MRANVSLGWELILPDEVFAVPGVLDRTIALGRGAPQCPLGGPDRTALLQTIEAAA